MPTYRYATASCACTLARECTIAEMESWEHDLQCCTAHGSAFHRDYSMRRAVAFREGWYEHIAEEPVYVRSMAELRRLARDNGVYSHYAEDLGGAFGAKEGRWI